MIDPIISISAPGVAAALDGAAYREGFPAGLTRERLADAGLVVVVGASDDLIDLTGAIHDAADAYEGGSCLVDPHGVIPDLSDVYRDLHDPNTPESADKIQDWLNRYRQAREIRATWSDNAAPAWTIEADFEHHKFTVMDYGDRWCAGIVFHVSALDI